MIIAALRNNQQHRGNKGKAGAQIGGYFALSNENVQQGAHAIHEQAGGGIHIEQEWNQHGGAKHGKQVL